MNKIHRLIAGLSIIVDIVAYLFQFGFDMNKWGDFGISVGLFACLPEGFSEL